MSLLSDLNNKIKALSTRMGAEVKALWSGIDSKVANVTLSGKTLTVTKGDGTSSTYTTVDTNTTYSNMTAATASAAGAAGLVPAPAAGKQTSFLRGDGTWVVPTNTTYTAGTGLSLSSNKFSLAASGVTAGTAGPTSGATLSHGGTFTMPYITFDAYGRATSYGTRTLKLPTDNNTDTKVTNTASNTTKFFITGTSSSSTNTGTQYFDTGVYVTATAGYLHCTRLEVGSGTIWVA